MEDFIPFAGDTHALQNRKSELGSWFINAITPVNQRVADNNTAQGFYVVTAGGKAYGFNNNRSVDRVLNFMASGLKQFHADPSHSANVQDLDARAPQAPTGAAIVRVYSRIDPVPMGAHSSNANIQRDHLWILADELKQLQNGQIAPQLVERLCRFVFVDAVRGEPNFWQESEVKSKDFKASIRAGKVNVSGTFWMETRTADRGVKGSLEMILDVDSGQLISIKGYAATTAWGQGTYTPNPPAGKFNLNFAFVLPESMRDVVPPQGLLAGRDYLGD